MKDKEQGLAIWADAMAQLIAEKQVHPESWELLWRDISLLPPEIASTVTQSLWQSSEFSGTHTILSAFFAK